MNFEKLSLVETFLETRLSFFCFSEGENCEMSLASTEFWRVNRRGIRADKIPFTYL